MSKEGKNNKWLYITLGILFVFSMIAQYYKQTQGEEQKKKLFSNPTSYDTGKSGHKALFLLLSKMGYKVDRFKLASEELKKTEFSHLVMISPYEKHLSINDARRMYDWVYSGNSLILIDEGENPLWQLLAVKCKQKLTGEPTTLTDARHTDATANVKSVGPVGNWRFELPPPESHPFTTYLQDEHGVICAGTTIGKGNIIILSAPLIVTNSNINSNDNVIFLTNLFAVNQGTELFFNETIHGLSHEESFDFSPTANAIFYQIGFAVILFYLVYLIRFGKPRLSLQDSIRASTEYIQSLGNLFLKARSKDFAAMNLLRNFARRTGKSYGVSTELSRDKLIESLKLSDSEAAATITRLIEEGWQAFKNKNISDAELLRLSSNIENSIKKIQGNESRNI